jgi:hypothetical protein
MAHKLRLGSLRPADIQVVGGAVDRFRSDFVLDPEYAQLRKVP